MFANDSAIAALREITKIGRISIGCCDGDYQAIVLYERDGATHEIVVSGDLDLPRLLTTTLAELRKDQQ